mgnify:CR=1 FL=1
MIWPAQVLSYKISKLKINPLRERAKKCIETKFDFRAFHDQILGSGRLSLSMLKAPWMLGLGKSIIYRLKLSGNVWCFHAFLFGVVFAAGFVFDLAVRFVFDSAVAFLSDGGT